MDSFDDFEMKPLTEGLGFHKKKVELKSPAKKTGLADKSFSHSLPSQPPKELIEENESKVEIDELMSALEQVSTRLKDNKDNIEEDVEIIAPLPRKPLANSKMASVESGRVNPGRQIPDAPVPNFEIDDTDFEESPQPSNSLRISSISDAPAMQMPKMGVRRGAADSPPLRLRPAPFSLASACLDVMVVLAFALMFLLSLLLVTGVNLSSVFAGLQTDFMTQLSMGLLYLAVYQMYMIVSRSFFGRSLGEWTFDYQLGDDRQINSSVYPILVLWRSMLMVMTGIFVLPLFSLIIRKDMASYLTGLQLYKRGL